MRIDWTTDDGKKIHLNYDPISVAFETIVYIMAIRLLFSLTLEKDGE